MSIIRWGEQGSNVYIICSQGGDGIDMLECVGCSLKDSYVPHAELAKFMAHLDEHRKRGDCVPDSVTEERFKREIE